MQTATLLEFVRPVEAAVERPFAIKYRIGGVACELSFETEDARKEKAAELVNSGVSVVFKPAAV